MPVSAYNKTITTSDAVNAVVSAARHQETRTALVGLTLVSDTVQRMIGEVVADARRAGHSWADIGDSLGMTRQAAHERFRSID